MSENESYWPEVHPLDDGIRPAGRPDHCFFCQQAVGYPHLRSCVVVTKTVRFRITVDVDMDMPHGWTKEEIETEHIGARDMLLNCGPANDHDESALLECHYLRIVDETPDRSIRPEPTIRYQLKLFRIKTLCWLKFNVWWPLRNLILHDRPRS